MDAALCRFVLFRCDLCCFFRCVMFCVGCFVSLRLVSCCCGSSVLLLTSCFVSFCCDRLFSSSLCYQARRADVYRCLQTFADLWLAVDWPHKAVAAGGLRQPVGRRQKTAFYDFWERCGITLGILLYTLGLLAYGVVSWERIQRQWGK